MYAGSGGGSYKHGVGMLLHARWVRCFKQFVPVNARIADMDICSKTLQLRFVTAYFPHRKYADRAVQEMCDELPLIVKAGARGKLHIVMGADCDAQVGPANDTDNRRVCGKHAHGIGDARGQWLKQLPNTHNLVILKYDVYQATPFITDVYRISIAHGTAFGRSIIFLRPDCFGILRRIVLLLQR
eukprot:3208364-Pyramimonas_sp.AAC.1